MQDRKLRHVGVAIEDMGSSVEMQQKCFSHFILSGLFEGPLHRGNAFVTGSCLAGGTILDLAIPGGKDYPVSRALVQCPRFK